MLNIGKVLATGVVQSVVFGAVYGVIFKVKGKSVYFNGKYAFYVLTSR